MKDGRPERPARHPGSPPRTLARWGGVLSVLGEKALHAYLVNEIQCELAGGPVSSLCCLGPLPGHGNQIVSVLRPVMQGLRIEIRAVGPLDCPKGRLQFHGVEERQVPQRSKHVSLEDGLEVYSLTGAVIKSKDQSVRTDDIEVLDAIDGVAHGPSSAQWIASST
jgi:hypothetical protein